MYIKLSYKNASKSIKDYGIYFLTLVFGVCVFYMFNAIDAQKEIMEFTQREHTAMKFLKETLNYISVFVSIVLGFLIVYANGFLIKRRKKELGVYLTLGMEKHQISIILILETMVLAIIGLLIGLVVGIFGSQIMSVFTAKLFEVNMTSFKFVFSPTAALKSVLFFSIIFLVVTLFNTFTISKCKLLDLLYSNKKNQEMKIRNKTVSFILFILSLISLAISYYLILTNGIADLSPGFYGSLLFGTVGTFLFFLSISGLLIKIITKMKKVYLKNLNVFVVRQIASMINTNVVSMTIVCITLLLTIGTLSSGVSMSKALSRDISDKTPYDISFYDYGYENEVLTDISEVLEEHTHFSNYTSVTNQIFFYNIPKLHYKDIVIDEKLDTSIYFLRNPIKFISLSDYNRSAKMQGNKELSLSENEYAIINLWDILNDNFNSLIESNKTITINNNEFYPNKNIINLQLYTRDNMYASPIIIINDKYITDMKKAEIILNANFKDSDAQKSFMTEFDKSSKRYLHFTKDELYTEIITGKTVSAFLAIYLGFVFLVTCAAILSIQQLSQSSDNKERYELLKKLGTDEKMLNHTLFTQILIYFLLPLSLAIVHSVVGLIAVNQVIVAYGKVNILANILMAAIFLVIVYGAYFMATYIGSKNVIKSNRII
ncbi:ABC transporter permease [Vallitalea sediminicola]